MQSGSLAFALTLLLTALGAVAGNLPAVDTSFKPGDDFYKYVNGKWLETATIPPDKSYYGTVVTVFENTEANLHAIVDELAAGKHEAGSVDQKVADFYASWMDAAGIEARGLEPAKPYLERIAAAKDKADLMKLVGSLDFTAPFGAFVEADTADPTRYTVWVTQTGPGGTAGGLQWGSAVDERRVYTANANATAFVIDLKRS